MTNDPKQLWMNPYRIVSEQESVDARGEFRLKVLDFAQAYDRTPVMAPAGLARYGWVLWTGGPNDPLVGAEPEPALAISRAQGLRSALLNPLNREFSLQRPPCAGCGKASDDELEPCPNCGSPTCDGCYLDKGGCGCAQRDGLDPRVLRAAAVGAQVLDETAARDLASQRSRANPTGSIPENPSALEEEANNIQMRADAIASAQKTAAALHDAVLDGPRIPLPPGST